MCSKEYYYDLSKLSSLTEAELKAEFLKYKNGDEKAFNRIIEANLKLVIHIAKSYKSNHYQDLISEGNIGLIQAVKRYNPNRNIKFSYYASFWIKKLMNEFIINDATIRIPPTKYYEMKKNNEVLTKLIADFIELYEAADDEFDNEGFIDENIKLEQINLALKYLNKKQRIVFVNYYGIGTVPMTLQKISVEFAEKLGEITKQRCSQLLAEAEQIIKEKTKHLQ